MDSRFVRLIIILLVMAIGYSILGTPGSHFQIDVARLKVILMYVLLGAGAYAIYTTFHQRRPPGV